MFLMTKFRSCVLGRNSVLFSDAVFSWHPTNGQDSICPIPDDIHFDYLMRVVSARFLHCNVILLPSVTDKYFVGGTLTSCNYPVQFIYLYEHGRKVSNSAQWVIICYQHYIIWCSNCRRFA